jgi:hypothetical protein
MGPADVLPNTFLRAPAERRSRLADRPTTKRYKPAMTLPPQMSAVLIWPVFANVARALFSNSLVVGEHTQDSLARPLVHPSRLDRPTRYAVIIIPFQEW